LQAQLKITVFDCAIKVASTSCIERLKKHFSNFEWNTLRAMDLKSQDYSKANNSDVIFIFGSHSNVEDRLSWHHDLSQYTKKRLIEGVPTIGLCFGHQLIADLFGAEVSRHKSAPLKGLRKVQFKKDFDQIVAASTLNLGVSHSYEVSTIPTDFEVLASSPECRYDALKHLTLPYYSFQSHPEASANFFENECPTMTNQERELVLRDGLKVIEAFLQISLKELANSSKRA